MNPKRRSNPALARALCGGLMILTLLPAGCGREKIRVYRVAKEQPEQPGMTPGAMPAGHPDVGGSPPQLTWKTPEGWTPGPPSDFRLASFTVKARDGKQADVSAIPLPGLAGGDLANVNRWRVDQAGLPPVGEEDLKKLAQNVEIDGQPADLYDVAGKSPTSGQSIRILAAIQRRDGVAWFFKMVGDDPLVVEQKPVFVEFLKSLKFETGALPPAHPPVENLGMPGMPAGHPDLSTASASAAATSTEGKPDWQVPAGWKEVPGGQFLAAKFTVGADGGPQAAVNVSTSVGDGGGLLANVNRWRQQLKLEPVAEAELGKLTTTIDMAGGKAVFVDLNGTDVRTGQAARLVGAMVPQAGQTWYYKLMGDAAVVEAQKDAFTKFVQSAKY